MEDQNKEFIFDSEYDAVDFKEANEDLFIRYSGSSWSSCDEDDEEFYDDDRHGEECFDDDLQYQEPDEEFELPEHSSRTTEEKVAFSRKYQPPMDWQEAIDTYNNYYNLLLDGNSTFQALYQAGLKDANEF